ncbi:hypothetical protein Ndes2526B_g06870 [Nannochloris sp. 'desiccata']
MPRRRKMKETVDMKFNKDNNAHDCATDHLLSTSKTKSDRYSMSFFGKNPSYRLLSSGSDDQMDKPVTRDTSFTISAVHSVRSQQNLEKFIRKGLSAISDASDYRKTDKKSPSSSSSPYHLAGGPAASTTKPRQAYEVESIDTQLQRMFKLQLGPLTIGRDIAPVLDMWCRLQDARVGYGRKAIATTWSDLARATAIVAKKMTIAQIVEVIDAQCRLMYPCPRSLRIPADMLMALADRAGGALCEATDNDVLLYCASIGRLMDAATVMRTGPTAAPASSEQWLRALHRAATITPLVEAGMKEAARRGKLAAKQVNRSNETSEMPSQSSVTEALVVSGILAELAGTRLAAPLYCLNQAALAASAEIDKAQSIASEKSWWKKVGKAPGNLAPGRKSGGSSSSTTTIGQLLPSHTDMGTQESSRLAGEAAKCLERFILPAAISLMNPRELSTLATNLRDATADDAGAPYHEPLRQQLGLVVDEAVKRTSISTICENLLTRSCVREVMGACRARLLHVKFPLAYPEIGVAESLSKLESWKGQMKAFCKAPRDREQNESKNPGLSDEKEATSLELDASFSGLGEEGDEEVASSLRAGDFLL